VGLLNNFPSKLYIDLIPFSSELKLRNNPDNKREIFDQIRKKWVVLQPEEWIRQLFICFLKQYFPLSRISIEKQVSKSTLKRFDIQVIDKNLRPKLLIELKSLNKPIDLSVLLQATNYQKTIEAQYLLISNGVDHFLIEYSNEDNRGIFKESWPFELCS
jgi:hypothetical protein